MHPSVHAAEDPDRAAVIMAGSGEVLRYGDLDRASNRAAHHFRALGIAADEAVAVCLENTPRFFEIVWGALRSGLYVVPVSSRLTAEEIEYIVRDSGARLLVTSRDIAAAPGDIACRLGDVPLAMIGNPAPGFTGWDAAVAGQPDTPIAEQIAGSPMLYSSGTTGRPKGIRLPLPEERSIVATHQLAEVMKAAFGFSPETRYLVPAPLYHAAPLHYSLSTHRIGGTVVVMKKFDPEAALAAIERYRVTHAQFVPTHFARMLKLPAKARARYDLSSLGFAIHAAAPCPIPIKQAMIDWWGPIIMEYYAGSEGSGTTLIGSADWLAHPGSVGRAIGCIVHVCDDDGEELARGQTGLIYFEGPNAFHYHNDPAKTAAARNAQGWSTLGDIGRLDEEGFLYLTDRKSFMIISGGVNIYPQEIENLLITHPRVLDAAVIGAPDPDMGEQVVAVVQPGDWSDATEAFAAELDAWLREQLAGFKIPRRIDFLRELPREPTGKLLKRLLRDEYWAERPFPRPVGASRPGLFG